ncbi:MULTISPECIES: tetraacyldisaccharide 4'-kinase [unclassified Thioalkalivibrio]|uniref:tetraacyldisaccharide 4'-kinase n=1 Tax=unclassified Thioalkalivibrio TaxID=2621013 RepID=UPI00036B1073|nr:MULTISPECIES: tetraacyldisaccharide 4'-kinase [unclassified Thioalkalivibrio]
MGRFKAWLGARIWDQWCQRGPFAAAMYPLSLAYAGAVEWNRHRLEQARRGITIPAKAVIVVGNLTVGGSGKTPMTIWLAKRLADAGYRPGIVSRGYGGRGDVAGIRVTPLSDPVVVGDEPLLIAQRTGVPVQVDRDRVRGARALTDQGVDVVIADDGMQHHRLPRDITILMIDGKRRLGNGLCLPSGPLREPKSARERADFVLVTGGEPGTGEFAMDLVPASRLQRVDGQGESYKPHRFARRDAHAVAGIADPERFFRMLEAADIDIIRHPFPDHHRFRPHQIRFDDGLPVLMTEKDAVKCRTFAQENHWYWPIAARVPSAFESALLARLETVARIKKALI